MLKLLSKLCVLLSLALSHLMCIMVTYQYTKHIYSNSSAPASVTFLYAIPFVNFRPRLSANNITLL